MIIKKVYIFVVIFLFVSFGIKAQDVSSNSLYMFNILEHNPAFAGSNGNLNTFLSTQQKWVGISGASTRYYFNINTPVYYNKIGLGAELLRETIGPRSIYTMLGTYAYHISLGLKNKLAFGLKGGIIHNVIDWSKITFADNVDKRLGTSSYTTLRVDFGAFFYSQRFFFGASLNNIAPAVIFNNTGALNPRVSQRIFVIGNGGISLISGYYHPITKSINLRGTIYLDVFNVFIPNVQVNFGVALKKLFFGIGASNSNTWKGLVELNTNKKFKLGYAFSYHAGNIAALGFISSHELILNYKLPLRNIKISPLRGF